MCHELPRRIVFGVRALGLLASLALIFAAVPLRGANKAEAPKLAQTAQAPVAGSSHPVYTNADIDKLAAQDTAGNTSHRVYTNADIDKLAAQDTLPNGSRTLYTNADVDKLASQDLISLVGPEPVSGSTEAAPTNAATAPSYAVTQDPNWYAEQVAQLNAELYRRNDDLRRYAEAIDQAKSRQQTEGGVNLVEGNFGVTLESGQAMLESRVREVQNQLDALADLARRNGIALGNQ
jgi:hypothetical protein